MSEKILKRDHVRIKEIPRDQSNSDFQRYNNIPSIPGIKGGSFEKQINPAATTFTQTTVDSSTALDIGNSIDFVFVEAVSEIPSSSDGYKIQMSSDGSTWKDVSLITFDGGSWSSSIKNDSNVHVQIVGRSGVPVDLLVLYGDWL